MIHDLKKYRKISYETQMTVSMRKSCGIVFMILQFVFICLCNLTGATMNKFSAYFPAGQRVESKASIDIMPKYRSSPEFKNLTTKASMSIDIESYYFSDEVIALIKTGDGSNVINLEGTTATKHWSHGKNRSLPNEYLSKQPGKMLMSMIPYWGYYYINVGLNAPQNEHRISGNVLQMKIPDAVPSANDTKYYYFLDAFTTDSAVNRISMYFFEVDPVKKWTHGINFEELGQWHTDYLRAAPPGTKLPVDLVFKYSNFQNKWPELVVAEQYLRSEQQPIVTVTHRILSVRNISADITPESLIETLQKGHEPVVYYDAQESFEQPKGKWIVLVLLTILGLSFAVYFWQRSKK